VCLSIEWSAQAQRPPVAGTKAACDRVPELGTRVDGVAMFTKGVSIGPVGAHGKGPRRVSAAFVDVLLWSRGEIAPQTMYESAIIRRYRVESRSWAL